MLVDSGLWPVKNYHSCFIGSKSGMQKTPDQNQERSQLMWKGESCTELGLLVLSSLRLYTHHCDQNFVLQCSKDLLPATNADTVEQLL
jgi:hypothetical protein